MHSLEARRVTRYTKGRSKWHMRQKECGQCESDAAHGACASYVWSCPILVQRPFCVVSPRKSPAWIEAPSGTQCAGSVLLAIVLPFLPEAFASCPSSMPGSSSGWDDSLEYSSLGSIS